MKRYLTMSLTAMLFAACVAHAQNATSHIAESKQNYQGVKNNLQRMAEQMPEENYAFKASPDVRTFGELVAHVADTQARLCSMAAGEQKSVNAASKTSRADLASALKDSSAICDAAFDSLTEATAAQPGGMGRSKLALLEFNTGHSNEEYGYMSVYMRLKGIVPPSSAGRGAKGSK
ncbi:MAG TPA: DinB family protein [Bryobacteraceae bacterium]|jgi:hypothetical protein